MTEEEYNRLCYTKEYKIFKSIIKYRNFVTPELLDIKRIKNHIVEISTNYHPNIIGKIYGITVITKNDDGKWFHDYKLCKAVDDYTKVENYLKQLENE